MTNKLSLSQIDDAVLLDNEELEILEDDIDESSYRNTFQRREIRTKRKRDEGELVGKGNIHKHRKY